MRHLIPLALCVLLPSLSAPQAQASKRMLLPDLDRLVVREQCFGHRHDEVPIMPLRSMGYLSGAASAPSKPMAKRQGRVASGSAGATIAESSAPPTALDTAAEAAAAAPESERRELVADDAEAKIAPGEWRPKPQATVYLSNDDSMSLASAQRMLYAVERDVRLTPGEIRHHELLNYFSFDTTGPRRGETFGVQASALRVDNDTLSLAVTLQGAAPPRPSTDLTILLDRSGSMSAEGRMSYTRRALELAHDQLRIGDRLNLVLFDHEVCTPIESFVVGRDDPRIFDKVLSQISPRGSTDLDRGLKAAYSLARRHAGNAGRAHRVMVMTDALLNTGDVNPHTVTDIGHALEQHDIRLTGVGVGRDFRDDVLDRLTEKGKGAYVFLGSEAVVDRFFGSGFDALVHTIAHDVQFALDLPPSLRMQRFYGEEISTRAEDVQPVHFHAGNSQVFLQDLEIVDRFALSPQDAWTLRMTWRDPATNAPRSQTWRGTVGEALRAPHHNISKARALMAWSDLVLARATDARVCQAPYATWRDRASVLRGDTELAWLQTLVSDWCPRMAHLEPEPLTVDIFPTPRRQTRVRIDADVPVSEVSMTCGGIPEVSHLADAANVAVFQRAGGNCEVRVPGRPRATAKVNLPPQGADVRCHLRGGQLTCR